MSDTGVAGSDESFISFAFAMVSLVVIGVYLPLLIRTIKFLYDYVMNKIFPQKKRRYDSNDEESPIDIIYGYVSFVPKVVLYFVANPLTLQEGLSACLSNKKFAATVCFPRLFKFCFRPKVFILWLWFILLSSAMYATLTFDAHGILGVSTDATTSEIKKAYRQLVKINHPDKNKTAEAARIYPSIRKAYKALVDKEAFEAEQEKEQQDFAVGVALPKFLTNRENDGLVLFALLAVLVGVPVFIWYKYVKGGTGDRLMAHMQTISENEPKIEIFLERLGIVQDVKYTEKKRSKEELVRTLKDCGMFSANMTTADVENFPHFLDFKARCLEPEKYKGFLYGLGFDDEGIVQLNQYFSSHPENAYIEAKAETPEFVRVSDAAYKTNKFLLQQLIDYIESACDGMDEIVRGEMRSCRRLRNHHRDLLDNITVLYEREKYYQNNINALQDSTRKGEELANDIPKELNQMYRKSQIAQYREMGLGNTAKEQQKNIAKYNRMLSQQGGIRQQPGQQE